MLHRDNALILFVCAALGRVDLFIWIAVVVIWVAVALDAALLAGARGREAGRAAGA